MVSNLDSHEDDQAYVDRHFNAPREQRRESLPNRESDNDDAKYAQRHYDAHRAERVASLPNRESAAGEDYDARYVHDHYDAHRGERAVSLPNRESDDAYLNYAAVAEEKGKEKRPVGSPRKPRMRAEMLDAAGKETPGREEAEKRRHRSDKHKSHRDSSLQVDSGHLVSSPSQSPRSSTRAKALYSPRSRPGHPQDRDEDYRANARARGEYHPVGGKGDAQPTGVHPQDLSLIHI